MERPRHNTLIPLFDELVGERVTVRPYRDEDAERLFAAVEESRQHIWPWLPWGTYHQTVEDSLDFIRRSRARWILRDELNLGIFETATGRYLGGTGYHIRNLDAGYFEIGYWLRASAAGHGYMTETVRLLTDYAFEHLGANRVEIRCDARNTHSAAVAERLGFVREGRLRNTEIAADGVLRDTLVFALTASDPRWPQGYGAARPR